ncbi:MAG: glycosyltransferase [Methanobrevibacter sp.]|jgi:glycosyltransferase involved in cell wall biosynthesis|nr:glycosyltransferase [Candidatus Methanovirga procula]
MAIFNAEKDLKKSLNSIINQTMDLNDIEVIMVDDASTDESGDIINEYSDKYENFIAIHLNENMGGAYGPRNIGLKKATGKYIMFLDSDDSYLNNTCQLLYDKIENNNVDIVFGRYLRIDQYRNLIQKSYTPYLDEIYLEYDDDILNPSNMSGFIKFFWKNLLVKMVYGKIINKKSEEIKINCLLKDPTILKILPSIWTKIFRKELIEKYGIEFPPFISGEDLNFIMEYYFNTNGILLLNNDIICNHYVRDEVENRSITKKIGFKLVYDSLKAYCECSKLCNRYNFKKTYILLNPFLLNWIMIFLSYNGNIEENKILLNEVKAMKKEYNSNLIGFLLLNSIILLINLSNIKKHLIK